MRHFCNICKQLLFKNTSNLQRTISTDCYRYSKHLEALKEEHVNKVVNSRIARTHNCGELNLANLEQNVSLCGWLEYQRMNNFAVLRDGYGSTQIIVPDERRDLMEVLKGIPLESTIAVQGIVKKRPENHIKGTPTGEVEIIINDINVLNPVQTQLPFSFRNRNKASELTRLKHRYLDIRFFDLQRNLRQRSELLMKMRNFLHSQQFVEVETPTLFKKTPGGAREFIVPTKSAGDFFCLVQSPQQFKQLLMVGGIDKYYQIARCYRDETARPDRQPEFTQLDLEMSFSDCEDIISVIENMLAYSWHKPVKVPFQRITFTKAFRNYGTDQPDISFDCLIKEVKSSFIEKTKTDNCNEDYKTYIVKIPQAAVFPYWFFGALTLVVLMPVALGVANPVVHASRPSAKIYYSEYKAKELSKTVESLPSKVKILHYFSEHVDQLKDTLLKYNIDYTRFNNEFCVKPGDIVFISRGPDKQVLQSLGKKRVNYLRWLRREGKTNGGWDSENAGTFLWITDFPLLEECDSAHRYKSVHHPFTMPHPDDVHLLASAPLKVRSLHYDLVLDGYEVGGGSVRIHNPNLQRAILQLLEIPEHNLQHLLVALASGAPPHSGIALGIDRLVSIMCNTNTIRDVIAFPKTSEGKDLLSGAPSQITEEELKYYKIRINRD